MLKFELYQPGDIIIKEGTFGDRMFFIQQGIVDIITVDGIIATSLSDGSFFGGKHLQIFFNLTSEDVKIPIFLQFAL